MKKVKLTQEQADAIEKLKQIHLSSLKRLFSNPSDYTIEDFQEPLFNLTPGEYHDALYIGYEVEPEFKIGDWVAWENHEGIKITSVIIDVDCDSDSNMIVDYKGSNGVYQSILKEWMRYATNDEIAKEKQVRWWKRHGRDVWELKVGDVLINNNNTPFVVVKVEDDRIHFQNKGWVYHKDLGGWLVICFAEDRKDLVKNNQRHKEEKN